MFNSYQIHYTYQIVQLRTVSCFYLVRGSLGSKEKKQTKRVSLGCGRGLARIWEVVVMGGQFYYFQIMSKKHQPQKGEKGKTKIQTVNQQNEPYLRALQKKIRNLNKKLTQISELQGKDNLKPEQLEKVNRKAAVLEEIAKIEENANYFKEVYAENAAQYRDNQLKELEVLARALAIYHSASNVPEQQKLNALWRALEQTDKNYSTINEAITAITTALKEFANDWKLQKLLTTHVEKHGNEEIKNEPVNQEKIVNDILEEKPAEVKQEEVQAPKEEPQVESTPAEAQPELVAQKVPEVNEAVVEKEDTPIVEEPAKEAPKEGAVGADKPAERRRGGGEKRGDRAYKGKGGYKERNEGENKRRQYKPKHEGEQREQNKERSESSSSSSSDERGRQFRKEEIHKLQEEGFTVVGLPKPKPKDRDEVRNFHDRQHGKKHHHHGRPTNY